MDGHDGGCHCGRLRWRMELTREPEAIAPRACDCDFCTRHGAAWVSDPDGALRIRAREESLQRYRQGSGQAQFLICARCGVLAAVVTRCADGHWRGAANANAFDQRNAFAARITASPQLLPADTKAERWAQLWTPVELDLE